MPNEKWRDQPSGLREEQLQVVLHGADSGDAEVLYQHLGHIGAEEGGEGGAQVDVLDAQVQQSQQDDDGLLLVPGNIVDNGQVVDIIKAKDLLQLQGEVSCGYLCDYVPDGDGYKQQRIRGNHVAVVHRGRAGHDVAIKDAAPEAEKGRKKTMSKFAHAILTAFGMAAKDASEEELNELVTHAATALDAAPAEAPAEPGQAKAQEAEPAKDVMVERAPKGDDLGAKLDRILELLEAKSRGGRGEHPLHDESDLDEMVEKLTGKKEDPEAAVTVPAEEMEDGCMSPAAKDAAVELLKRVRPAVAAIQDKKERARVVDALLSTIKGPNLVGDIMHAAQDSARKAAQDAQRNNFQQVCADAESAYAARNPHKNNKEG